MQCLYLAKGVDGRKLTLISDDDLRNEFNIEAKVTRIELLSKIRSLVQTEDGGSGLPAYSE